MELVKELELKISEDDCFSLGGKEYYNFTIKFNNEKEFKILAKKRGNLYEIKRRQINFQIRGWLKVLW